MGLKQLIVGGDMNSGYCPSADRWDSFQSHGTTWAGAPETDRRQGIPTSGTISRLFVRLSADLAAGKTRTYTLYKNGVATALSATVAAGTRTGSDVANSVSVAAYDFITMGSTSVNVPPTTGVVWSALWESTLAGEGLSCTNLQCALGSTQYGSIQGQGSGPSRTGYDRPSPAGTYTKLAANLAASPGVDPDGYKFTLEVDAVDSALTVTITAPATTGTDAANSVHVDAGQMVNIKVEPLNVPATSPLATVGVVFIPDDNVSSLITASVSSALLPPNNTTSYQLLPGSGFAWDSVSEANKYSLTQDKIIFNGLYVSLQTAPGAGKSWVFTLRVNDASTPLVVTIADANKTGSSTNSYAVSADWLTADIMCVPSNLPNAPGIQSWTFAGKYKLGFVDSIARRLVEAGII